jgi:hypothetical protein
VHARLIMAESHDLERWEEGLEQVDRIRQVARVMDDAFTIPGTSIRIGLDPLIGLIPGAGDVVGAGINGWIIMSAARLGASRLVLTRMLANAGVDALFGAVPFLGDLFDFAFKAHRKNLRLLEEHLADPREVHRRSRSLLLVAGAGVTALLAGLALLLSWGVVELLRAVF